MIFVCTAKTFCRNELRKGMLYTNFFTQLRAAFFPIKSLSTAVTAAAAVAATPPELAEIRAVARAMIVTTMSAYHRQRISVVCSKSFTNRFSLQIVLRGLANPPGSVDVIPTAGCAQCAWCSFLTFVRAWALGALF